MNMTVAQEELDRGYSKEDAKLRLDAETAIEKMLERAENNPDLDALLRELADFDIEEDGSSKPKINPATKEEKRDLYLMDQLGELIGELKESANEAEGLMSANTTADIQAIIEKKLGEKTENVKKMTLPLLKIFSLFTKNVALESIKRAEKAIGIPLKDFNGIELSKIPPDVVNFISRLANKKMTVPEIMLLYPLILNTLRYPGKIESSQGTGNVIGGYINFGETLDNVEILLTSDVTTPSIPERLKSGMKVTTSLNPKSIESQLAVIRAVNENLFNKIMDSISEVLLNKKGSQKAFGTSAQEFNIKRQKISEIGKLLGEKHVEFNSGKSQDTPEELSREEQLELEDLARKASSNPIKQQERDLYLKLKPKVESGTASVEEVTRYERIAQKIADELKLDHLSKRASASGYMDSLQSKVSNGKASRKESAQFEALMGSQKAIMNNIIDQISRKRDDLETKDEKTAADVQDLKMYELSINFLDHCQSLPDFLEHFYEPLLTKHIEDIKSKHSQEGSATPSDEVLKIEGATAALKDIERMVQHLVITMYTDVIEAGGEPDSTFEEAASKAFTQLGYTPRLLVSVISRALTGLKASAAVFSHDSTGSSIDRSGKMGQKLAEETWVFATAIREKMDEYTTENRGRQTVNSSQVSYALGKGSEGLHAFTNMLERQFDVFDRAIRGSYTLRYLANKDPGKYFENIMSPQMSDYIKSEIFDVIHSMADGELVAQMLPTVKMLIMDFFNERGWIVGQELEEEAYAHKRTVYTYVSQFLQNNYPDLSDNQRRKIAYLSVGQAYNRFMFQEMMSKTRSRQGFQGKLYHRANAHYNMHYDAYMFAYDSPNALVSHKAWGRGIQVMPAWIGGDTYKITNEGPNKHVENIKFTPNYGALIEYGTGDFGHFLTHTDEHFAGTVTRSMLPYNLFDVGSDDKYRGWRQMSKSIGNVSTTLYERISGSDRIQLRKAFGGKDQLTVLWKSVENIGINYLRTYFDPGLMGIDLKVKDGVILDSEKYKHFSQFIFNRYFVDTPGHELPGGFRKNVLSNIKGFEGVTNANDFWIALEHKAIEMSKDEEGGKKKISSMFKSVLDNVYLIMLAERNPTVFLTAENTWISQTGENIWKKLQVRYAQSDMSGFGFRKADGSLDRDAWDEARNNLIFIQSESRGRVTKQVKSKRDSWELDSRKKKGLEKNVFGNFDEDYSDVSIVQGGNKGYVITKGVVEKLLREKYEKLKKPQEFIDQKVKQALRLYEDILVSMTETPELPDYEKLHQYYKKNSKEAFKSVWEDEDPDQNAETLFRRKIGESEVDYKKRYSSKLVSRTKWFMKLWTENYLGVEPEMDFAEDLTVYGNADEDHISRMAGMVLNTVGNAKAKIGPPNDELSFAEQAKNFAKDPFATIDEWSKFLNPFRKTIEDELGPDAPKRFLQYYMMGILDASLKEDFYRSGLDPGGIKGTIENVLESVFGYNKTSLITERNQYFISRSLGAYEANKVVRYLLQKKLINPDIAKQLKVRMKATMPQVFWELSPYLTFYLLVAIALKMQKDAKEQVSDKKSK